MLEDALHVGFVQEVELRLGRADTVGTHLNLLFALLAADVEQSPVADGQGGLQQQGALADARFATEQHKASWHDAAAEHSVEFAAMGCYTLRFAVGYFLYAFGFGCCRQTLLRAFGGRGGLDHLFGEGAEFAAVGAASEPAGRLIAAMLAEIVCLCFSHGVSLS